MGLRLLSVVPRQYATLLERLDTRPKWCNPLTISISSSGTRGPRRIHAFRQQRQLSDLSALTTHWLSPDVLVDENDVSTFRNHYFQAEQPVVIRSAEFVRRDLPSFQKWFIPSASDRRWFRLNDAYLGQFGDALVPLELTSSSSSSSSSSSISIPEQKPPQGSTTQFHRLNAPLSLFLEWTALSASTTSNIAPVQTDNENPPGSRNKNDMHVYLAQCQLSDLPPALAADFHPAPRLVTDTGRNDIYATSLWIGVPPTFTPLHRDPNPNLFAQLSGTKRVRMLRPQDGMRLYELVRNEIDQINSRRQGRGGSSSSSSSSTSTIRGEEMMIGAEREILEEIIWGIRRRRLIASTETDQNVVAVVGYDLTLDRGDALFIPKGWWHSLKGTGEGVTTSVNWWFR